MAKHTVTIGSLVNFHAYESTDFDKAMIVTDPISAGDPVDPEDVVTLKSLGMSVSDITSPTELNGKSGSAGQMLVVESGGAFTIYAYNESGATLASPYVMQASPQPGDPANGPERWIAIGGSYSNIGTIAKGDFKIYDLYVSDTNRTNFLKLLWNENDTADRVLNLLVDAGNRSLTLKTVSAVVLDQDLQKSADVQFDTVSVTDESYGSGWDGAVTTPTKNALYDKIQAMLPGTAVNAACTDLATAVALLNQIRTALINIGTLT